ncbi:MAG: DUF4440 domain-containing protein [Puniceicoccaceae bacterium]|nr:MAG: DUF4440 domain-containing protein [Puniceicoccaceae bacterium]
MSPDHLLREWMARIRERALEPLLGLYQPDAILIPTFSNRFLRTAEDRRAYFQRLFDREELGIALHEKTITTQAIGDSMHCLSGVYRWETGIVGNAFAFEARFTFVADLSGPDPILHHHSSRIPRSN